MIAKKILGLFLLLLTFNLALASNNLESIEKDLKLFTDSRCVKLKDNVKNAEEFQSEVMKELARKILDKKQKFDYLCGDYEAYPTPQVIGETLKLGDGFSKYENITGVYLEKGEHVVIVGETHGRPVKLLLPNWMRKPADGVEPAKDPNGWGLHKKEIPLKTGVNIIQVETPANAYIGYFADDYEKAPKISAHFVTGKVNGYFDTTRGNNDENWNKLLEDAVSPIMDARGKYIQVAYPVEFFKKFTQEKGVELINAYDRLIEIQYDFMGLIKYNKVPRNRVLSRVNFNYYMFRDKDGVAYLGDERTMRKVADPKEVVSGDPCWGFSHEVGHVMQMRPITWGGMTEVSNNLFSMQASLQMGNKSRLKGQNNYAKAREEIIGKGISYLQSPDVFNRLVPFWQLHLYFKENGKPDFYADVMEYLRQNAKDYVGDETIKYQFEFIKACCIIGQMDLSDFFDKWGFFRVGELKIGDYANYHFNITREMVNETKKWISEQKYKKPKEDITLTAE